jgi:putative ABC transport system substrate-binding protein
MKAARPGKFILLAGALAGLAGPSAASAAELPRIGLIAWSSCDEPASGEFALFLQGLDELGYRPGETVVIECRAAQGRYDGLGPAATALAAIPVDVIVTTSQPAGQAAHDVTDTIPIVTSLSGDPVSAGLAASLAKPGGNVTGVSYYATELTAKRLELLKEMVPDAARIGVLANPDVAYLPFEADARRAAEHLGLTLSVQQVSDADGLDEAFAAMVADGAQAVFILPDVMFAAEAARIAELALAHRLPAMAWGSWFSQLGCLMAYSADYAGLTHRLAFFVDRILKGAAPGDLPIEQPVAFKLWINMATAEALGVEPPQTLLLLADEMIE